MGRFASSPVPAIAGNASPKRTIATHPAVCAVRRLVGPGSVAQIALLPDVPYPRTDLSHDLCDGYAKGGEAVQDGDPDLELRDLTIEVPRGQTLAQQFDAMHLCLDAASAMVAAPSSPDRPAEAFGCAQGLVARDRARRVGLPWLGVLARRDDGCGPACGDGVMALAGVEGTVGSDAGDFLIGWDLVEKLGQHPSPVRSNRWRSPARHLRRRWW